MSIFKTKVGMVMAGVYLLLVGYALIEANNSAPPQSMDGFALIILTSPWSFLLAVLVEGFRSETGNDPFLYLYVLFGTIVNALILLILGGVLTKLARSLSSTEFK